MGRHAKTGYTLRRQTSDGPWSFRFRLDGRRFEVFLGTRDRAEADRAARRVYAEALARGRVVRSGECEVTAERAIAWLASPLPIRPLTRERYRSSYVVRWIRELPALSNATATAYVRKRLAETRAKSVRSEVAALRGFARWLHEEGYLAEPVEIPSPQPGALGTPSTVRRRVKAPHYTPREVWAVICALPAKSGRDGYWVRARCAFVYETGLRTSTVDRLSVPEHWAPGETELRITDDIDKEGAARDVPLSDLALLILEGCAPQRGVIFGAHKYAHYVGAAAAAALPPSKAAVFTPQHLRSARLTHLAEDGASLPGIQFLAGHARVSTAALYVRASKAAAARALGITGRAPGSAGSKPRRFPARKSAPPPGLEPDDDE